MEHAEVLRDVLLGRAERVGQLLDTELVVAQPVEQPNPHRLADHTEPRSDELDELIGERVRQLREGGVTVAVRVSPQHTLALAPVILDAGVDLLVIETCQDILQAKAALAGVNRYFTGAGKALPVIVSVVGPEISIG